MGRIRTIKPSFFTDEDLFDLETETNLPIRVAYSGLWTQCDREGRFKWKHRSLKASILPHDNVDFSRVLDALWSRGFIEKYQVDGEEFGLVPTFLDHQVINNRESASTLPEPLPERIVTRDTRVINANTTPLKRARGEGKGKEGKGREGKEGEMTPPTIVQVEEFFKEKGYRQDIARKAHEYYATAQWKDSKGNKVKNWKQKMISVWFKDEHKDTGPPKIDYDEELKRQREAYKPISQ